MDLSAKKEIFSHRLNILRKEQCFSQEFVAQQLNVSLCNYHRWEEGKYLPRYNTLTAIAKFFDVDTAYLLGEQSLRRNVRSDKSTLVALDESETNLLSKINQLSPCNKASLIEIIDILLKHQG